MNFTFSKVVNNSSAIALLLLSSFSACAMDNLVPEEIENLVRSIRNEEFGKNDSQDNKNYINNESFILDKSFLEEQKNTQPQSNQTSKEISPKSDKTGKEWWKENVQSDEELESNERAFRALADAMNDDKDDK